MNIPDTSKILVTCAKGIAPFLEEEIKSLGFRVGSTHETGAVITGKFTDTYKLNLELRTAYNVLFLLKEFECNNPTDLYAETGEIEWENIIPADEYLTVVSQTENPSIKNSMFANQKLKDAVVDRMTKRIGKRPDSGPERKNVVINLYWKDRNAWIYLNTSGGKLADRGYRKIPLGAPMQETLAAAVLLAAKYDGKSHFVNPMCGSGTIAIEAALIALDKAPGLLRSNYGFMHLKNFDKIYWQSLRKETLAKSKKGLDQKIIATDIDNRAVEAATANARTAGVEHLIEFKVSDFSVTNVPSEKSIVLLNPEYGERMGTSTKLEGTYKAIGDFFKQKCKGSACYVFTGNLELAKKIGLRAERRVPFYNGDIECRLLEYDIF
ncbi:MAG: class I SAM-dependent RNA methyltransferase [Candidatus Omnitrophica bacterium]|nr:class I SAM-dependent RNA methyltransferase [Candidatus Omnitrophota bacterium]